MASNIRNNKKINGILFYRIMPMYVISKVFLGIKLISGYAYLTTCMLTGVTAPLHFHTMNELCSVVLLKSFSVSTYLHIVRYKTDGKTDR